MKKPYVTPQLMTMNIMHRTTLLAGSSMPTEVGDDLQWNEPNSEDVFDSNEEIA
jgi:hypothetical protein